MPEPTITINGKQYTLDPDDLELGEVELLEEEMDCALDKIDFGRAKAMRVLVFILLKREDPEYTMEQASKLKLGSFVEPEEGAKRPTRAARSGS